MPRTPRVRLAALLVAGAGLVLTGCSDPAPTEVPTAGRGASATSPAPGPSSASASPGASSATPSSAPSGSASASAQPSSGTQTAPPKKLDEPTRTAGVQVSIVSVRAATIKTASQVDRSGPGLLVRLEMRNQTSKTFDASFVQVAVVNSAGAAGALTTSRPTVPLGPTLEAGARDEGTYAFVLPGVGSGPVTVQVYVTAGSPVVQFRGRAS